MSNILRKLLHGSPATTSPSAVSKGVTPTEIWDRLPDGGRLYATINTAGRIVTTRLVPSIGDKPAESDNATAAEASTDLSETEESVGEGS